MFFKECTKCGKDKELSEYYVRKASKDGLMPICKICSKSKEDVFRKNNKEIISARNRAYRDNNKEKIKACQRKYMTTDKHKESNRIASKKYAEGNKEKKEAHRAVHMLIDKGLMEKADICEKCGAENNIHAHHDDYSKPLEIRWLCGTCHRGWHKEFGSGLTEKDIMNAIGFD